MDVGRLVRAMPFVVMAGVVLLVATVSAAPVSNPDTFFHLRFGREFLSGDWSLWHPGTVTPFATAHWVPTQWLGEIGMAEVARWLGLPGVAWLAAAVFLTYVTLVYVACRRVAGAWAATAMTALATIASSDGLSGRPQVVSYLLVVVVAEAWRRTSRDGRPRWWLLGVAWVWPMVHGMWPLGIAISGVAALGIVLDRRRTATRREVRALLGLPVLMAVVAAVTPVGPRIYPAVLLVGGRAGYYTEWGPPNFHRVPELALLVLVAVVVALRVRTSTRSWYALLSLLLALAFCVYTTRTVPVAAGLLAPMAASAVGQVTGDGASSRRRDVRIVLGVAAAGLVVLACVVPFTAARAQPTPGAAAPAWLDRELASLPAGAPLLNVDYLGGYVMWRYPDVAIYADGYGDTFTTPALRRHAELVGLAPGWPDLLRRTGARHALLESGSALGYALVHTEGWRVVHHSSGYEWLTAPAR